MTRFIGISFGMPSESTGIVVVEAIVLPRVGNFEYRKNGFDVIAPVFQTPDGQRITEHPPLSFTVPHLEKLKAGTSYAEIVERTKSLQQAFRPAQLVIDVTGVGRATVELFQTPGCYPVVVTITAGDAVVEEDRHHFRVPKQDLISTAQVLLQSDRLKIARGIRHAGMLHRELLQLRMGMVTHSGAGAPPSYGDGGDHHLLLALAAALWVAKKRIQIPQVWFSGTVSPRREGAYG